MKKLAIGLLSLITIMSCKEEMKQKETIKVTYPETKKVDTVNTYFGTEVKDPYRWLEDDRSAETEAWVKAENKVTQGYLANIPYREQLKDRLSKLWNYEKIGAPFDAVLSTPYGSSDRENVETAIDALMAQAVLLKEIGMTLDLAVRITDGEEG